jgi:hypothetical protein
LTFDEQLQRALDTLSTRLHDEVSHQIRSVGEEFTAAARAELAAAAAAPSTPAATGRLVQGIRTMSGAHSLTDVIEKLLTFAGQESARAGVLLVRGVRLHGWRFRGFDESATGNEGLDIGRDEAGAISQALETAVVVIADSADTRGAPAFARLSPGRACKAAPLAIGGEVVAVLYADAGNTSSDAEAGFLNTDSIEILSQYASQRLEALTAIKIRTLADGDASLLEAKAQ